MTLLKATLLVAIGFWIYAPALHGLWLWDDDFLLQNNEEVHDANGLWRIWSDPASLVDFFPLTVSVEWLEWQIWPNDPFCYHLTSLLCHLLSAMLVWHLFRKLGIRLAWLGALLFVVHPVMVESVAWMAELKNTLAMPPFLLMLSAWISFDRTRRWEYYFVALFLFAFAMLCKSSVVMFPFIIVLYAWWRHGQLAWTDIFKAVPFFVISVIVGCFVILFVKHGVGEEFTPLGGPLSRIACAGLSLLFYFSKCILPLNLLPIYPQWDVDPPSLVQFLAWPVLAFGLFWIWSRRQTWSRTALFGLGYFFINLLPFVGFHFISFMRFEWVMDHFLYVPSLGLLGLTAAAAGHLDEILSPATRAWRVAALVFVIAVLAIGSHRYAKIYTDRLAYWTYTARHNFMAWPAHNNRGNQLLVERRYGAAAQEFRIALALNPKYTEAHNNLGFIYWHNGDLNAAEAQFRTALSYTPDFEPAQRNLTMLLRQQAAHRAK